MNGKVYAYKNKAAFLRGAYCGGEKVRVCATEKVSALPSVNPYWILKSLEREA